MNIELTPQEFHIIREALADYILAKEKLMSEFRKDMEGYKSHGITEDTILEMEQEIAESEALRRRFQ